MILGIDIDGTITKAPEFFRLLTHAVKDSGGKVFILSSRPSDQDMYMVTQEELDNLGIHYDELILNLTGEDMSGGCPEDIELDLFLKDIWPKVDFCKRNGIDTYFDDNSNVLELFKKYAPEIQTFKVL